MDTLGFTIKAQMPNAKVVGPPQAGAFKERKSGKFLIGQFVDSLATPICHQTDQLYLRTNCISKILRTRWFPNCIRTRHKRKQNSMEGWNRKTWLSSLFTTLLWWPLVSALFIVQSVVLQILNIFFQWNNASIWIFCPSRSSRHAWAWRFKDPASNSAANHTN